MCELLRNVNLSSEAVYLKKYESFLISTCKINFHFYTCKDTSSLKWRDLTGSEKYKLLSLPSLFPNLNAVFIQKLWKEFATLNEMIWSESMSTSEIKTFASKAKLWLELFIQVYQSMWYAHLGCPLSWIPCVVWLNHPFYATRPGVLKWSVHALFQRDKSPWLPCLEAAATEKKIILKSLQIRAM